MKKFIFMSPFQGKLNQVVYDSRNNHQLAYGAATAFPIIPAISASVEKDETIRIIAVVAEYTNAQNNFEMFKKELDSLSQNPEKPFKYEYDVISIPYEESTDKHLELFESLISRIDDGDCLSADISYGSKPLPIVIFMALNYGSTLKKDVIIDKVVYGNVDFNLGKSFIYDITALLYMNSAVSRMGRTNIQDPLEFIRSILGM